MCEATEPAAAEKPKPRTVALMVFDGVELLDFAGPAEVFIVAGQQCPLKTFTVGPSREAIKTMGGIAIIPDHSFEDAPQADILVIPGGNLQGAGTAGVKWIKRSAEKAEVVMSVCFGAFLLADAELLDGIPATTHHLGIAGLKRRAPRCQVQENKRFVDSGKILTTAGVTAGIDGSLHLLQRLYGKEVADWTSQYWMEHHPATTPATDAEKTK